MHEKGRGRERKGEGEEGEGGEGRGGEGRERGGGWERVGTLLLERTSKVLLLNRKKYELGTFHP